MGLRVVVPALVAVAALGGCGTASELVTTDPAPTDSSTTTPREPPPSTPTDQPTTPTRPSDPPTTPVKTPKQRPPKQLPHVVGRVPFFASPSRNIGCQITRRSVRCDIREKSYRQPRRPASCDLDFGRSLQVGRADRPAAFGCVGDTVLGARKVLQYRSSTVVGDFGCTSRETGMRCYNLRTRHGFLVSREVVDVF